MNTNTTQAAPAVAAGNFRAEMARLGLTDQEVASATGLGRFAIMRRRLGRVPIQLSEIDSLAAAVGLTRAELLADRSALKSVAS